MKLLHFFSAICLLAFVATADAADAKKKKKATPDKGPDIALLFDKLDVNKDKKVDQNEFKAFTGLAANTALPAKKKKKEVAVTTVAAKPDKKKKKKQNTVSSELAKKQAEWFKKLDTNNDNALSLDEFTKVKEVVMGDAPESPKKKKKANANAV